MSTEKDSSPDVEELLSMLDDPDIGEATKETIRQGLRSLATGGFKEAYKTNLGYLSRSDLNSFSEHVFGWKPYDHHKEITKVLMDETRKRELIVIPPGHGKSSYVSVQFPSWYMGKYPEKSIILVSNTATQAEKFGAAVRDIIEGSREYRSVFPEAKKDESRGWTKAELFLANRKNKAQPDPNLFATGTGGPVLGRRADLIITDDMTSQDDASSQKIMEDQKLWFKETLMSRMTPGGQARIISILTRWSDKDLASMMMNDLGFRLTHMPAIGDPERGSYVDYVLPGAHYARDKDEKLEDLLEETLKEGKQAEITYSDAVHRWCVRKWMHPSAALWPTEFSYDTVAQIKREYGTVRFNLVYQGNPTGLQGDIFKREWFKYYGPGEEFETIPPEANFYQSVDVAVSKKESADYFVVLTAAVDNFGNIFIVDVYRARIEAPEQAKLVAYKYREYPKTLWALIESVAYQQALFQAVSNEGIPCRPYRPAKDKEARARSASARFEAGKVYINKLAPWRQAYEDELTSFPRAEHDDQVDATSSLLEEIALRATAPLVLEVGFE